MITDTITVPFAPNGVAGLTITREDGALAFTDEGAKRTCQDTMANLRKLFEACRESVPLVNLKLDA